MGLSHLKRLREEVQVGDDKFEVRGLNLTDITVIVQSNGVLAPLSELFANLQMGGDGEFALNDSASVAAALAQAAPLAVSLIIACAADEEDVAWVREIPFPAQIDALEKIAKLTFATEGGPKKVLETIIRVANGATATLGSLQR
jgi:hypothetical protein